VAFLFAHFNIGSKMAAVFFAYFLTFNRHLCLTGVSRL
jgi:hypothetical protein